MGFIFDILAAPIMLPTRGMTFIFNKITEQVNNELLDDGKVRMQLLELQSLLDSGQITEDEFYAAEEELLDRLDAILAFKEGELLEAEDDEADEDDETDNAEADDAETDDANDEDDAGQADDAMMSMRTGSETQRL